MASNLHQSVLGHYVWTSLLANQLACKLRRTGRGRPVLSAAVWKAGFGVQNGLKTPWKKKLSAFTKTGQKEWVRAAAKTPEKLEWESVEPSELIWAKWGRKLAPRCETKRLRRAIKRTSTSQKEAPRTLTLCYKIGPKDLQEKASFHCWCWALHSTN